MRSALADVPGIGPQRQRLLLRHFGSLKKIRDATPEEVAAVPGMSAKAAAAVSFHLGALGATNPGEAVAIPSLSTPPTAAVGVGIGRGSERDVAPAPPLGATTGASGSEDDAVESAFADVEEDQGDEQEDALADELAPGPLSDEDTSR